VPSFYAEFYEISLGPTHGAIVAYFDKKDRGKACDLKDKEFNNIAVANVVERAISGQATFVAVFPHIAPGTYKVFPPRNYYKDQQDLTVFPNSVAEVDFR
jgi:hypothetical protein